MSRLLLSTGLAMGLALLGLHGTAAAAGPAKPVAPEAVEKKTLAIPGATISYYERGRGRPALYVHALLIDSRLWWDQLSGLADARRGIAPDLPGFGFSSPITTPNIDFNRYADDLLAFMDAAGIREPVDVVALSAGATIAGLAYEKQPQRFRSMVIVSPIFGGTNEADTRYRRENARNVVLEGKDVLFRRFNEYIVSDDAPLFARARYKTMMDQTPFESFVAFLTTPDVKPRPDLPTKLKLPVLLPVGEKDSVFTPTLARAEASKMPDARVVLLAGAGRLLPLESPDALNQAIRDFWTSLDSKETRR